MKRQTRSKLAILSMWASLLPTARAQKAEHIAADTGPPSMQLVSGEQSQKPDPVPSPKPVPLPDQQPEQRPAPQQPPTGPADDASKERAAQTFTGIVLKSGKKYVLKTSDKGSYDLDDQDRARKYEGKEVQVTGILDESSKLIHVQDMKAAG